MTDIRYSDNEPSRREIPSFIEPRPPLIQNPFMRPRPKKAINLLDQFEEDSEMEEPDLVQVYLRMKPCGEPSNLYEVRSDKCLVTSLDTTTAGHGRKTQHNLAKMYTFSHIFDSGCTQQEVFDHVVKPNLKKLPDGHSFTLLTYGPSGSGKTYTLMGTVSNPGLVPRALEYIFSIVDAAQTPKYKPTDTGAEQLSRGAQDYELQWVKQLCQVSVPHQDKYRRMSVQLRNDITSSNLDLSNRTKYYVWVSYVEIYNEAIYDLLAPPEKRTNLRIREDTAGNVYVKGVRHAFVRSGSEAYDVMAAGRHSLVVAATGVHQHSSRSHAVFTITLLTHSEGGVGSAQVRLCDLAGCERQRATLNKGARLLESRAINSSLHVLERCLHVLRRKQKMCKDSSLVPYRESKLTRLLGSGLSGCRGEAVSMVVTLNPSPKFQHETKHVLALAAVAQDIQINNTTYASSLSLELSQDYSISSSSELMKLRADNERLHFELLQAETRNKELHASMEETQQQTSNTMREIVEETKSMMRQYYEAIIESLKAEMNEMKEEYESVLKTAAANRTGTPSKHLNEKVAQLMTELAVLKEELAEERLAKEVAQRENQHLLQCIEERDADKAESQEIEPLEEEATDNDIESEGEPSDPFNESLEPVYKNECADRSRVVNNSFNHSVEEGNAQDLENTLNDKDNSNDTLKNDSVITAKDRDSVDEVVVLEDEELGKLSMDFTIDDYKNRDDGSCSKVDLTADSSIENIVKDRSQSEEVFYESTERSISHDEIKHDRVPSVRVTYFVSDETNSDIKVNTSVSRETYFVNTSSNDQKLEYKNASLDETDPSEFVRPKKVSDTLVNKIIKSVKSCSGIDNSLSQFEQLEIAANNCDVTTSKNVSNNLVDINILKEKKTYFDENDEMPNADEQIDEENASDCDKTPETVKKRELHSHIATNLDNNPKSFLSSAAKVQERQLYFDEPKLISDEVLISRSGLEKRTYFDNIDPEVTASNKKMDSAKTESRKGEARSPSIVQEDVDKDYKPSTIKKLLKESFVSDNKLSAKALNKKHDSFDLFESPQIFIKQNVEVAKTEVVKDSTSKIASPTKIKERNDLAKSTIKNYQNVDKTTSPLKVKELCNIESVRKSIDRLVLEQKTKADTKQQINKSEPVSFDKQDPEMIHNTEETVPVNMETNIKETSLENTQSSKGNNTTAEFDNICKDLSNVRATEFELLVSQEMNNSTESKDNENVRVDKKDKEDKELDKTDDGKDTNAKHNLRRKNAHEKAQTTVKRSLRLRRGRKFDEENEADNEKLKDIINLKKEFSDVTMAVPAAKKEIRDIPSPEKLEGEEENVAPMMGIQSCPSKSVTRSRRKLFTPRAETLDESTSQLGDSNERVYVPRPSYHRTRARRKLL